MNRDEALRRLRDEVEKGNPIIGAGAGTNTYSDGTRYDQFIAPDGSMFTFVQTKPKSSVTSEFELRGTAKRVGE